MGTCGSRRQGGGETNVLAEKDSTMMNRRRRARRGESETFSRAELGRAEKEKLKTSMYLMAQATSKPSSPGPMQMSHRSASYAGTQRPSVSGRQTASMAARPLFTTVTVRV